MIMSLIGALLASAVLLRRMPLMALAVTLAGLVVASLAPKTEIPASGLQIVVACAAAIEICYMAATRTRAVSVTGVAMAGAACRFWSWNCRLRTPRSPRTAARGCPYPSSRSPYPWS